MNFIPGEEKLDMLDSGLMDGGISTSRPQSWGKLLRLWGISLNSFMFAGTVTNSTLVGNIKREIVKYDYEKYFGKCF